MRYKITYSAEAQRGIGTLTREQRRAVHGAEKTLADRPESVGAVHEGRGPEAMRRWVLEGARVTILYRVRNRAVVVEVVWLVGHP
ncbi:hypothetical protein [Streptomyces marincola]|uniref:hypothetical protein n=1 Tax=Streptomyces marincola TaxID=2878388 RepID=UPI001CF3276A|nr:hypothetical protein [Streptomyces marincola]UCM87980.1 hypothetical protein LC193_08435 [Streptomyces marincola]